MALTTAQKLAAAQEARHNLITGKVARVFVDQNGERVEFNQTSMSIANLDKYIAELQGPTLGGRCSRGPIGFIF